jgi:FAD/FMN-containing dehydrogenase
VDSALSLLKAELDTPGLYLDAPADIAAYGTDWTRKFSGTPSLVARPNSTEQVARLLAACNRHRIRVVPQCGNTGMVGGSVPRHGEVVISLARMNKIEAFDAVAGTVQVGAGVVLQALNERVAEEGLIMPVDLGARGSCQIGGMLATNAGGLRVLRYGHMREQLRGLEVVLADGTVLSNLNKLKKNNTGIDLKHIFVGSEGILGIITRAVLQVVPKPPALETALLALDGRDGLPALLKAVRGAFRGLSSLEFIVRDAIDLLREVDPAVREPFNKAYPVYVVLEEEAGHGPVAREEFAGRLDELMSQNLVADAILAESEAQTRELWRYREGPTEAISRTGLTHKFDVTVPQGDIPRFCDAVEQVAARYPGFRLFLYGHLGDGNVHVNMVQGKTLGKDGFYAAEKPIADEIYNQVADMAGSVSAEHGIGIMKRDYLQHSRSKTEIETMRRLKAMLDPNGILNPGVIFEMR